MSFINKEETCIVLNFKGEDMESLKRGRDGFWGSDNPSPKFALLLWASDSSFVNKDRDAYYSMVMRILDTMHTASWLSQSSTLLY